MKVDTAPPVEIVRHRNRNRVSLIIVLTVLGLGLGWQLASRYAVPKLIEGAYHGQSLPVFNRMISGQSSHTVEDYLAKWRERSRRVLMGLVILGFLAVLIARPEFKTALTDREAFLVRHGVVRLVLAVVLVFLSVELPSRALISIGPVFERMKGLDDASRRLSWIKSRNLGFEGQHSYGYLTYSATRGWSVRPGVHNAIVFENKTLNTNSQGIRGSTDYPYQRRPGKTRILTLGDSFTFGDEVSDNETYASYLETLLPDSEVLNFGVSGYGHDQMLLYFEQEGIQYSPDVVMLGYVSVDADRNLHSFNAFVKPKFEISHGELRLTNVPVPSEAEVVAEEPYRLKSLDLAVMLRERLLAAFRWNERRAQEITSAIFDRLVKTTRSHGAVPVFVHLPILKQITDPQEGLTADEQFLQRNCRRDSVACLFLRPYFLEQAKKGVHFSTQYHWEPQTHRLAAQAMRDFLVEKGLISGTRDNAKGGGANGGSKQEVVDR